MEERGVMETILAFAVGFAIAVATLVLSFAIVHIVLRDRRPGLSDAPALTRRLKLSSGQWADIRTRLTAGMQEAIIAQVPAGAELADLQTPRFVEDVTRAVIVAGVARWSYGPVDLDTLMADVPLDDQTRLAEETVKVVESSAWWRQLTRAGEEALRGNG